MNINKILGTRPNPVNKILGQRTTKRRSLRQNMKNMSLEQLRDEYKSNEAEMRTSTRYGVSEEGDFEELMLINKEAKSKNRKELIEYLKHHKGWQE